MKQKRKLKRNREMKAAAIKAVEKKSHDDFTPSDEDSSQSGGRDSEVDGKAFVTEHLNEPKEGREFSSASDSCLKAELQKASLISDSVDPTALDDSLKIDVLSGDSKGSPHLPSIPTKNKTQQSCNDYLPEGIQSNISVKSKNNIWAQSNQCSALKLKYSSKEISTVFPNMEGKAIFARLLSESGAENQLLGNEKEGTVSCEHEINTRTFSYVDLAAKQAHTSSDKHESCSTWSEVTSKVIYDHQRPKLRRPKKASERTTELFDYKSDKEQKTDSDTDVLHVDNDVTYCAVPLTIKDNNHKMSCIEIGDFPTESVAKAPVPSGVSIHPSETSLCPSRKKGRYRRTFKLAPQFDIPRQIAVGIDEKVLQDVDLLIEQEDSTNEENRKKHALGYHGCPEFSSYDAVVESSPPDIKLLLHNNSKQLTEESVELSSSVAASPVQINTSASCKAPSPTESQIVTVDKTMQVNIKEKREKLLFDISTIQPDILHSVNVIEECLADSAAKNIEQMQKINETKPTKYSQTDGGQDSLSTKSNFLKLPLSLGFALQLVEHFGSPGVTLGNDNCFEKSSTLTVFFKKLKLAVWCVLLSILKYSFIRVHLQVVSSLLVCTVLSLLFS